MLERNLDTRGAGPFYFMPSSQHKQKNQFCNDNIFKYSAHRMNTNGVTDCAY